MAPTSPIVSLLLALGVSPKEIALAGLCLASAGWITGHLVAWGWIKQPTSSSGLYAKIWPLLNTLGAANYHDATNLTAALRAGTVANVGPAPAAGGPGSPAGAA